jgi:hypothetical protein
LRESLRKNDQTEDGRKEMVRKKVADFKKEVDETLTKKKFREGRSWSDLQAFCRNFLALYDKDDDFTKEVKVVRELQKRIEERLKT